jgi:hypothetical protein
MFQSFGLAILTKEKDNKSNYRYYSSASSEGSRANEEGTSNASKSEATLTKGQRASAWSSLMYAFCPDLSNSSSDFSSGKWDKAATNVDRVPHRTPFAAAVLI